MDDREQVLLGESGYEDSREARARRRAERERQHRKRLEGRLSAACLLILLAVFVLGVVFFLVFPRSTKSQIEKRDLAKFPSFSLESFFSGKFTAGIATFYDDTVPYHDGFKNLGNNIKSVFGLPKSENTVEFVGTVNKVNRNPNPGPAESSLGQGNESKPASAPEQISVVDGKFVGAAGRHVTVEGDGKDNAFVNQEAEGSWENGLIVINQNGHYRALELFGGGGGSAYAEALNTLQGKVGDGVTLWSMPAPLACEFYTPSNYQEYTASQSDCFDNVAAKLNPGIRSLNICGELSKHAGEDIYCRTDHHWQPLGAYYAAKAFAEAAGVPFADLSTYTTGKNEGFVGSMYGFTGSADILNDPEDFVFFTPNAPYTAYYYDTDFNYNYEDDLFALVDTPNSYLMFMGGDQQVVKVNTQVKNDRRLLVVKDSYGNAEIPFYTSSFEQIYVVDMRYFGCNLVSLIQQMRITDVLFTMSAYSLVGDNADNLMTLITQNEGETITDGQTAATPAPAE